MPPAQNPFSEMSHQGLLNCLLGRLSQISNLRKQSRQHRELLSDIRSDLAALRHEVLQIEHLLAMAKVIPFHRDQDVLVDIPVEQKRQA
jgi:hypothetical protein